MIQKIPREYIILGKTKLNKSNFNTVKNRLGTSKPEGGLWASPYTPNNKYISAWHEWCSNEQDDWISNDSIILRLKDGSKIYVIDNQNDLIDLIGIFGERKPLYPFTRSPNFEFASKIFDVIYLTEKGQCETRFPTNDCIYNLYGWDCESILIMNFDCIENWEYKQLNII